MVTQQSLAAELGMRIRGEVRFDKGSRALYATDGSNYRQTPIGVVLPRDKEDVDRNGCRVPASLERRCSAAEAAPAWPGNAATLRLSWTCRSTCTMFIEIDPHRKLGRVQPGCVLDDLRNAANKDST